MVTNMSKSSWQRKAPVLALLLAVGTAGVVAWQQSGEPDASLASDTYDLSSVPATKPEPVIATPRPTPAPIADHAEGDGHGHDAGPISTQDVQAQLLSELGELEREFLSEPVSETWSSGTELMITESLSEARLAPNQVPVPVSHDSECRSNSCRIRVTYRNEMDAQMGEIFLLGGIAERLPNANFGRLVGADGSVQIVMYANTGPARKSR